jgi:hypothetical protein
LDPVNDEGESEEDDQKRLYVSYTLKKLMKQDKINRMTADAIKNELSILFTQSKNKTI